MQRKSAFLFGALMTIASILWGASLDKAKSLRSNGLRQEAKREMVEVLFDPEGSAESRAEALLLLGDIALEEKNPSGARENWDRLITDFPGTSFPATAHSRLDDLARSIASGESDTPHPTYKPGTLLVIGPSNFPWAAPQVAGAAGENAVALEGSLDQAIKIAAKNPTIAGVLEVALEVDVPFESGRIVCYGPRGTMLWQKVVRVSSPGGQEHIARNFVKKLSAKIKDKNCP